MAEYIDKKQAIDRIASCYCMDCEHSNGILCRACEHQDDMDLIDDMPAADVQPLSVVAEHIKNRLYETAFNTDDRIASDTISDMAERIDFWIDELKDGDING